jgi:hypothetical protein
MRSADWFVFIASEIVLCGRLVLLIIGGGFVNTMNGPVIFGGYLVPVAGKHISSCSLDGASIAHVRTVWLNAVRTMAPQSSYPSQLWGQSTLYNSVVHLAGYAGTKTFNRAKQTKADNQPLHLQPPLPSSYARFDFSLTQPHHPFAADCSSITRLLLLLAPRSAILSSRHLASARPA